MAEIKAFRGLRYTEKAGDLVSLVCPPYDIISREQRDNYIQENPNNIIRLELPKPVEDKSEDFAPYETAGKVLNDWLSDGILAKDDKAGIYVYEMLFEANGERHAIKGFVSLVKLEEFSKGIVLPHEETLSKAKTERFNLMKATNANFSQIYSLYTDDEGVAYSLVNKASDRTPDAEFTHEDGIVHRLWAVYDDNIIAALEQEFADKKIYIADGHHRYETALNYRNYVAENGLDVGSSTYVPMYLVNMENDGLVVFPTHRIVRGLENFDVTSLLEKAKDSFLVTEKLTKEESTKLLKSSYIAGKNAFSLYCDGAYHVLVLKDEVALEKLLPDSTKALRELDVTVLHSLILEQLLGIDKANMAAQINLNYTKSEDEATALVDTKAANCTFILNPTRVSQIKDVSLEGGKMPQKSTYFYPKLLTGLVMNKID